MQSNEEKLLEQIFDYGFAKKTIKIGDKYDITIKSLTAKDYMDIDHILLQKDGTKVSILQQYSLAKLSKVLIQFHGKVFSDSAEAEKFLEGVPAPVIDRLFKEQAAFEAEVTKALNPESIEANFFETPGSEEKSEQLPKA